MTALRIRQDDAGDKYKVKLLRTPEEHLKTFLSRSVTNEVDVTQPGEGSHKQAGCTKARQCLCGVRKAPVGYIGIPRGAHLRVIIGAVTQLTAFDDLLSSLREDVFSCESIVSAIPPIAGQAVFCNTLNHYTGERYAQSVLQSSLDCERFANFKDWPPVVWQLGR